MGRDIVIIPNRGLSGGTTHPEIRFSGLTDSSIKLKVEDDGSIVFDGNTGGLFEITDSKDGLLSAVSDVSGLPILAVYSDNRVVAGKWDDPGLTVINNQVFVGPTATTNASLYVSGNEEISGTLNIGTIGGGTPIGNLGFDSSGNVVTGSTTVDADTFVTGGTYSAGTTTFTNNTGGTFNVTGSTPPLSDVLVVGNATQGSDIIVTPGDVIRNQTLSGLGTAILNLNSSFGPFGTWEIESSNGAYLANSPWIYGQPNNGTQIAYQLVNYPGEAIGIGIFPGGNPSVFTGKEIVIADNRSFSRSSGSQDKRAVFIGTRSSTINGAVTNSVVIGGVGLSATQDDTVYVDNLNINTIGGGTPVGNLGFDSNGNVVTGTTGGGGGVTIDPYFTEPSALSINWDVSGNSTNYQTVLTGTTTLNLSNVRNGDYGTIIVQQDGVGSRTITFGTVNGAGSTHRVVNGGGGLPTLTSNPNAIDILSFTYNGSVMYWTVGNDYT